MATSRKKEEKGLKYSSSSGNITNLKQSIFSFDIYGHIWHKKTLGLLSAKKHSAFVVVI